MENTTRFAIVDHFDKEQSKSSLFIFFFASETAPIMDGKAVPKGGVRMFNWLTRPDETEELLKLRKTCIDIMANSDPSSAEYETLMKRVGEIDKMLIDRTKLANEIVEQGNAEKEKHRFHLDWNMVISGVFSLGGILLITCKEQVAPVASRAFNFVFKGRG